MPISLLPTPPTTADPSTFVARADSMVLALPQFVAEMNYVAAVGMPLLHGVRSGTVSAPNVTPVPVYTLEKANFKFFLIVVWYAAPASAYFSYAFIMSDGTINVIKDSVLGAQCTLTLTGDIVYLTQNSGGAAKTFNYRYLRF